MLIEFTSVFFLQVCRLFNGLIASTATLQLIIELHAAGQENGPSNPEVSPADRLDALRKREAAWDKLQWSKEERMPMLNGTLWELYGGVFAQSDGLDSIKFRRLPSIYRSIDEAEWTIGDFGHPLRDFGMDPAQDLLVLVESHRWLAFSSEAQVTLTIFFKLLGLIIRIVHITFTCEPCLQVVRILRHPIRQLFLILRQINTVNYLYKYRRSILASYSVLLNLEKMSLSFGSGCRARLKL